MLEAPVFKIHNNQRSPGTWVCTKHMPMLLRDAASGRQMNKDKNIRQSHSAWVEKGLRWKMNGSSLVCDGVACWQHKLPMSKVKNRDIQTTEGH